MTQQPPDRREEELLKRIAALEQRMRVLEEWQAGMTMEHIARKVGEINGRNAELMGA